MKQIEVVAAVIIQDGKILAAQKGQAKYDYVSYKWEFPGGKVEAGETLKQAITREILEELNIRIIPQKLLITINHQYPDFFLTMHCFICDYQSGKIQLTEHIDVKWLSKNELNNLDWADADKPILKYIL